MVEGAGSADVGRIVRGEAGAKCLERLAVPDSFHALLSHVAEVDAVGSGDYAARHGVAPITDVGAGPRPEMDNLQDPANVAQAILFAVRMPAGSVVQEVMVTPLTETSWP
jgi:hypothetical protein